MTRSRDVRTVPIFQPLLGETCLRPARRLRRAECPAAVSGRREFVDYVLPSQSRTVNSARKKRGACHASPKLPAVSYQGPEQLF